MEDCISIIPPVGENDTEGATRIFNEFLNLYASDLSRIEEQLGKVVETLDPIYAEAYRPWQVALHDLLRGAYLIARKIPLPDTENFIEALFLFSIESAIDFLRNICVSCRLILSDAWAARFRHHIDMMLLAFSILMRNRQQELAR